MASNLMSESVAERSELELQSLRRRIDAALDKIRPLIQADGGDAFLVKVDGDVAYVSMIGACGGCAAAAMTLKGGIEAIVTTEVPEIRAVEQI